jgi:Uroporphyrinogen decarboxylase (URO-D)
MPLIFTLAAKLEDIPLSIFVRNPTKIANSLVAIYQRLRPDGVTCYFDLLIVAEALGCQLDWSKSPPAVERPNRETALKMLRQLAGEVKQRGRLPIALEVVHRVEGTLPSRPLLVVGLPGPLHVAHQLFGQDILQRLAEGKDDALDNFEALVEITLSVAQTFCLAGTHLLYFDELDVPMEFLPNWEAAMVAVWKTVRFHSALPVLSTPQLLPFEDQANTPLLCLKPDEQAPLPEMPFALALPTVGERFPDVSKWVRAKQCLLVTTDGEIPYRVEIQKLHQHVAAMRSLLDS